MYPDTSNIYLKLS